MGNNAHHDVQADWVLNRQFLRIQKKTASNAPASVSEILGYGTGDGNQIRFIFEYPDGPFHNTYRWNAEENTWQWLMEQKNKDGKWVPFANLKLTWVESPRPER
jgi:hypothetical protein